jgi:hypothetical protein
MAREQDPAPRGMQLGLFYNVFALWLRLHLTHLISAPGAPVIRQGLASL